MEKYIANRYAISISMFILAALLYFPLRELEESNEMFLAGGLFVIIMVLFFSSIMLFAQTFTE